MALFRDAITWKITVGTMVILVIGLALIGVSFAPWFPSVDKSWLAFSVRELGGGLVVAAIAGFLIQVFVERYRQQMSHGLAQFLEQDVTRDLRAIREDIAHQTDALVQGSSTLDVLRRAGVGQMWESRGDALDAMRRDLEARELRTIRVMGISLNDFLRVDQQHSLHTVWRLISSYLRGDRKPPQAALDVRVLVIDPNSYGGLLRSFGEARDEHDLAGRLDEDVTATARRLADLKAQVAAHAQANPGTAVTFDFRFYRVAPTVFMMWTDSATYMQPYYFWSKRQFEQSMPVMRFETAFGREAMRYHFELLWQFASVDGESWLKAHEVGLDRGNYESGMVNLFTDPRTGYGRLRWLIEHARKRVYIMGISLKSFFEPGFLFAAVLKAMADPAIDVRVLLLDPDGMQAKYRSFREHQFTDHCGRQYDHYEDYHREPRCHSESTLAQDTLSSIRRIQAVQQHGTASSFKLKVYDTSPSCFLMIADDHALVEQYHYGKYVPGGTAEPLGTPPVLGKDMPLVEFSRTREDDPLMDLVEARSAFDLVLSHFNFVFNYCAKPCPPALGGLPGEKPAM